MDIDLVTIFVIGFLGGFGHCIGMCGGFVMTYTLKIQETDIIAQPSRWQMLYPHLLYNSGRVVTYVILGEIFGFLGSSLGVIFALRDIQGILQLFAGLVMVAMGIELAGWIPNLAPDSFPGISGFKKLVQSMFNRVNRRNIFVLGLILGFIPCGLVYAAGAKAAATQSIIGGMMTMLVFGLGTFPAMVLTGVTVNLISARLRHRLYRIAAILVIILGVLTILRGIDAMDWIKFYWLV
jgi:sulfite exporter TauE/SafE